MQKNVPTLLGILIILVVVVLVVLIYNIKLTEQLGTGAHVSGTVGGEVLTGEKAPTVEISPGEAVGRQPSPAVVPGRRGQEGRRGEMGGRPGRRGGRAEGAGPARRSR